MIFPLMLSRSVQLLDCQPDLSSLRSEVLDGLRSPVKRLPCKLFYDEKGSRLFEQICQLPEYYLTRTEMAIIRAHIAEIVSCIKDTNVLIEYGSGSSEKTRILLDHLPALNAYVPIDISKEQLLRSAHTLLAIYPKLAVLPVCADYNQPFALSYCDRPDLRKTIFFPGSTIGNFHPHEATDFLKRAAQVCGIGGGLLIGVDLKKDPHTLNRAYNDLANVTAAFNLNLLTRLNRELGADFQPDQFCHYAFYNQWTSRVEMHLISKSAQMVQIDDEALSLKAWESIWTESSYKYSVDEFAELAWKAGFRLHQAWTDKDQLFSVQYLIHY
ncbi:MAG: L-histidine N(alpha)-methyltransferase [Acidobacteriota bacterium]